MPVSARSSKTSRGRPRRSNVSDAPRSIPTPHPAKAWPVARSSPSPSTTSTQATATRSMWDGLQIIKAVIDAGAAIKVLDRSYIDLATPMGRGFMAMMSAMAEDERLRIIKRTHEGRQIARAKGVRMGRKPKLTPHQMKEARQRLAEGEPTRSLAKSYGVSISTISRLAA